MGAAGDGAREQLAGDGGYPGQASHAALADHPRQASHAAPADHTRQAPHADAEEPADLSMGTRLGDFTLLARVGRGAQGEVYAARQDSLGRLVAVKVLSARVSAHWPRGEAAVRRFQREALAGGRLAHPGLVAVHALGEHEGIHYIAQELVPHGRTLAHLLDEVREAPALPPQWPRQVAELLAQAAEALHAAHQAGVVHRDVKPGNILLTPEGRPKIADFGLALVEDDSRLSHTGELAGTPCYMSPEQAIGARASIDHRTDVFSLGTTLYEALTLQRPFTGDTREDVLARIREDDPPAPSVRRPEVPRDLSLICLHALEKRPAWRYASAADFAADLRRWLAGEPIAARPPAPWRRAAQWAGRRPVLSAAGAVAVAALLVVSLLLQDTREARHTVDLALQSVKRAEQDSRLERDAAERERTAAAASVKLFEQLIADSAPVAAGSDPEQFRQLLDRGTALLDGLEAAPEAHWHQLLVLGSFYRDLAQFDEAEPLLEEALALAQELSVEGEPRLLRSQLELARLRRLTLRLDEARALTEAVLAHCPRAPTADGPDALEASAELGRLAMAEGRLDEAEASLRFVIEESLASPQLGAAHPEAVAAQHVLGHFLLEQGRVAEAEAQLLAAWEHAGGALTEVQLNALAHSLARLRDVQGRAAARDRDAAAVARWDGEAEGLFRRALEGCRRVLGDNHVDTAAVLTNYSVFLRHRGRLTEARPLLAEALELLDRRPTAAAAERRIVLNDMGVLDHASGAFGAAEQHWRDVLADEPGHPPRDAGEAGEAALHNLISLLAEQGRFREAEPLAEELLSRTAPEERTFQERERMLRTVRERADGP